VCILAALGLVFGVEALSDAFHVEYEYVRWQMFVRRSHHIHCWRVQQLSPPSASGFVLLYYFFNFFLKKWKKDACSSQPPYPLLAGTAAATAFCVRVRTFVPFF
jgi:hypothetical protein